MRLEQLQATLQANADIGTVSAQHYIEFKGILSAMLQDSAGLHTFIVDIFPTFTDAQQTEFLARLDAYTGSLDRLNNLIVLMTGDTMALVKIQEAICKTMAEVCQIPPVTAILN